jgi:hypothetical protein
MRLARNYGAHFYRVLSLLIPLKSKANKVCVPGSRALHALENYLERKTREILNAESIVRNYERLNYRQLALLSHALRKPTASFTLSSHRTSHRIAYATTRAHLLHLVGKGLLEKKMRGGTMYFELEPVLMDLMKQ